MRRNGLVTTREDLIEAGWGYLADVKDNTLDVYVHGLRAKLDSQSKLEQTLIRTIHGTGYMFVGGLTMIIMQSLSIRAKLTFWYLRRHSTALLLFGLLSRSGPCAIRCCR